MDLIARGGVVAMGAGVSLDRTGPGGVGRAGPRGHLLALLTAPAYDANAVKQPLINVEEKIDRFVGKRTKTPDALSSVTSNKTEAIAWQKALGGLRVPRGVYRFKTHEEADAWLWRMIARPTS